ncbi:CBO0543 family protein [Sporosalibacterium faouarense]|uniref:CBO0543 family protein n=1 Tax=Sporosalibacterium faouarense TaxID=516123 RepID=UPI00192BF8DC|nr:CBO0543 family protein [Sporosalibacterium faouarense]
MEAILDKMSELQRLLVATSIDYWKDYVFNTWQWWVNIGTLILPLILWWKLVNKSKLINIMVYGFFASGFAVLFDIIGETLVLWEYPFLIIPMDYILIDTDYSILPVAYMLIYQKYSKWSSFIFANVLLSAIFSFIAEPLLIWIGFYELHGWRFIYSFPIYIAIAIVCRLITEFFIKKENTFKHRK